MRINLVDISNIIRSKNAGPYELTFDIMFKTAEWFERICRAGVINAQLISRIYNIAPEDVLSIVEFHPASAIKITIRRPMPSGALGETDVYGAQQHAPLLGLVFEDV